MARESNFLKNALKRIPLETRLNISIQSAFINLITELGYRENKAWADDENEILDKLIDLANVLSLEIIEEIIEWKQDGKTLDL